jgi:transcriptional antiterminator RfaH
MREDGFPHSRQSTAIQPSAEKVRDFAAATSGAWSQPISTTGTPQSQSAFQSEHWYCARTKPKREHMAAGNLRKSLNLEVFLPRLRFERATQRGAVHIVEPLFPCYVFVRCVLEETINEIKHTNGISSLVHFGLEIPKVEDLIIEELRKNFEAEEPMAVQNRLLPGDEVAVADGAFAGMSAHVLRNLPARNRVRVLLDILGRPTPVEVDRSSVVLARNTLADLAPIFAAPVMARI